MHRLLLLACLLLFSSRRDNSEIPLAQTPPLPPVLNGMSTCDGRAAPDYIYIAKSVQVSSADFAVSDDPGSDPEERDSGKAGGLRAIRKHLTIGTFRRATGTRAHCDVVCLREPC
ncbi:hypothetical protein DPEC_G00221210 [Dallia pectoralis]|uniref:Uncharacterized protein n=1 Tax=Dallia pectoralis TaxID=75939 RepID=A0ACC2G437_DALPE|nr:hypothetical protein DPEC_G00221210 [Dallia pectoralis]